MDIRQISVCLIALVLLGRPAQAQETVPQPAQPRAAEGGPWSQSVNELQGRIVLKRKEVVHGTPRISVYLELRTMPNKPLKVTWDRAQFRFRAIDKNGTPLPKPRSSGMSYSGQRIDHYDLALPSDATLSFDYSLYGYGVSPDADMAALILLAVENTQLIARSNQACFLTGVLEIPELPPAESYDGSMRRWTGRLELPPVEIPVKRDPAAASSPWPENGAN